MREDKIIDENLVFSALKDSASASMSDVRAVLNKAGEKKGLSIREAGILVNLKDPALEKELFEVAGRIKSEIYGERLVFFAPLYVSDFCVNDCKYCNFHSSNKDLKRKKLTLEEVRQQTELLIRMGHKRVLVEFGEDPVNNPIDYICEAIKAVYSVKSDKGNIRRINVNISATSTRDYRKLKEAKIGTYQLFQETYHKETYDKLHCGPKADYSRQITAYNRAFEAGIDDLGIGVLFGLYDWRFEVLALLAHAEYMERNFRVGPHTISIPRFRGGETIGFKPEYEVSDEDFLKLIAILRLSVPYTGMIISTRESPQIRKQAFKIGISQSSAASCTVTGGYGKKESQPQFSIYDERSLQEVIADAVEDGFMPSFCTACYRLGRTGEDFMDISKPGHIHHFCRPNAILTFAEYLEDFTSGSIYDKGYELISRYLGQIEDDSLREKTASRINQIKEGKRDFYF